MNDSVRYAKREIAITSFVGWLLFLSVPVLFIIALFAWDYRWALAGIIVGICQSVCARAEQRLFQMLEHHERGERMWDHAKE